MAKKFGDDLYTPSSSVFKGSCYHSHPALVLKALDGVEYKIYGGNCHTPVVRDADIYIGFAGDPSAPNKKFPWEEGYKPKIVIDYPITDMCAPKHADSFKQMVTWVCNQLQSGAKIHAGCLGGHGRTGMFLVAVCAELTGEKNAIQYVRKHYCKKAVETKGQIEFLMDHYGVSTDKPTKGVEHGSTLGAWPTPDQVAAKKNGYQGSSGSSNSIAFKGSKKEIKAVTSSKLIW